MKNDNINPRSRVSTRIHAGRIWVSAPYELVDVCRSLPGRRWDGTRRSWHVPCTPAAAAAVIKEFSDSDIGVDIIELADRAGSARRLRQLGESVGDVVHARLTPWTHQRRAVHMIREQDATMLAHDMGTGKTKSVIDSVLNTADCNRVLVLCPATVVDVWVEEFETHAVPAVPVACTGLISGSVKARAGRAAAALDAADRAGVRCVIAVNYEAAWREPLASWAKTVKWDMVVCDESHRIKAPDGKQSRFCAALRQQATRRVCLTGTPMPHSPLDVYAQYRFLDPGIYGTSFAAFRARYAVMGGYGGHQVLGYQNLDELHEKFYSIADRVTKRDVIDLPPVIHEERRIELRPATTRAYRQMETEFVADVSTGVVTAANALARLLRLQQMTSGFAVTEGNVVEELGREKRSALLELLSDDLDRDEPVVVFARFHHDLDSIRSAAAEAGRECYEISGSEKTLDGWKQSSGGSVIAVQEQAGGLGIDLTRSAYCVFFSLSHSLGDYLQALARCDRSGQTRSVTYIHLVARGTVDAKIYRALSRREEVIQSVLAGFAGNAARKT